MEFKQEGGALILHEPVYFFFPGGEKDPER